VPLESGISENGIKSLGFGDFLDSFASRNDQGPDAGRDFSTVGKVGRHSQIFDA
jgi:hypothetical protein